MRGEESIELSVGIDGIEVKNAEWQGILRNWWRVAVDIDGGRRIRRPVEEETHALHGKVYSLQWLQSQTSVPYIILVHLLINKVA